MAEIVEPDVLHAMLLDEHRKLVGQGVAFHAVAHLVDENVAVIVVVVAVAADLFVILLRGLGFEEVIPERTDKGESAQARFGLGRLLLVIHRLPVDIYRGHGALDGDSAALEIDGVPFQPKHLTAAEAVERGNEYRQLIPRALDDTEQLLKLRFAEEDRGEAVLSGAVDLVRGVLREQIRFDGVLERLVYDGVVVDDGVGFYFLQLFRVKTLNVVGLQF